MLDSMKSKMALGAATGTAVLGSCTVAMADAAVPVANTAVTGAFADLAADLGATLGVVAVAAIGVYVIILGFRFAKKVFNQVAK